MYNRKIGKCVYRYMVDAGHGHVTLSKLANHATLAKAACVALGALLAEVLKPKEESSIFFIMDW